MTRIISIGTDIVECLRIAQMIEHHGELFINRVYTPSEIEYCRARKMATQHFAGRWAAKEAILKAWAPAGGAASVCAMSKLLNEPGGRPVVNLTGGCARSSSGWESPRCW